MAKLNGSGIKIQEIRTQSFFRPPEANTDYFARFNVSKQKPVNIRGVSLDARRDVNEFALRPFLERRMLDATRS